MRLAYFPTDLPSDYQNGYYPVNAYRPNGIWRIFIHICHLQILSLIKYPFNDEEKVKTMRKKYDLDIAQTISDIIKSIQIILTLQAMR